MVKKVKKKDSLLKIPFSVFRQPKLTTFEALVKFLKEKEKRSYREIGSLLGRDERNIWTVYNRSLKKCKKDEK